MDNELVQLLDTFFAAWPGSAFGPLSDSEVAEAERRLGARLSTEYRDFVLRYGGAVVRDKIILGLRACDIAACDPPSFVDQTLIQRGELPVPYKDMVVISVDLSGNPVGYLANDPTIFTYDYDFGGRHEEASSFGEYLRQILAEEE
jgi:hypothetical protein